MNNSMIRYILGQIMKAEGLLLLLPCIVALIYKEHNGWWFLLVAIIAFLCGIVFTIKKPKNTVFYLKEGCIATALSWIVLSIFGALPFILTGEIKSFTDAIFETVSGFTTTGASILPNVELLSHCSIFWRSFTHWVGGMGVLVFILAIIPMSGGSPINLMRAESPGPSVGKLVPKIKQTARYLYLIYLGLTVIEIILLLIGKMPVFDALTMSFGTAGTGGFGIKCDSAASYTPYMQWVITVFMILFGVNFNAFYFILLKKIKKALHMEEVRYYFIIIVCSVAILFISLINTYGVAGSLRHSAFQVASIITTTGFSTVDFNNWPHHCQMILIFLMFIGACAGSTGGGIKVSRIAIMFKTVLKELKSYIHPKSIKKITFDGKPVEHDIVRSTNVFLITYILLFSISLFIVSFDGRDFLSSFTAIAATINNIGPGLGLVGPASHFGMLSIPTKWVLIFDMLAGRLELFPLLILFHPVIWKDNILHKMKLAKINRKKENK